MRRRIAIAISSLVAAAVLAVGLAATGFGPEPRSTPAGAAGTDVVQNVGAETVVQGVEPEVVYVKSAPKPETVVVKKRVNGTTAGNARVSSDRVRTRRSPEDDDDDRGEHRRESAKERREARREDAHERREREHEYEDDD
jgi:hypothetical protein